MAFHSYFSYQQWHPQAVFLPCRSFHQYLPTHGSGVQVLVLVHFPPQLYAHPPCQACSRRQFQWLSKSSIAPSPCHSEIPNDPRSGAWLSTAQVDCLIPTDAANQNSTSV